MRLDCYGVALQRRTSWLPVGFSATYKYFVLVSTFELQCYFLRKGFFVLLVVVDDMCFVSKASVFIEKVKQRLQDVLDLKLLRPLQSFIR